jgi:hypothetical protein
MSVFKKDLTPLSKGGAIHKHAGKGSEMASMPDRGQIGKLAKGPGTINDYAKATPLPTPSPAAVPGIGSGSWPGNGM